MFLKKYKFLKLYEVIKQNYLLCFCSIYHVIAMSILYPFNLQNGSFINILIGVITYTLCSVLGYYVHVFSHIVNFEQIYKSLKISTYLPKPIDFIIKKIVYILDFHDKIHHNTKINKLWYNIVIETLINLFIEGVGLIILLKIFNFRFSIKGNIFKFNYPILFAWSLTYATVHNINYHMITPICHIQHHLNKKTNYGTDFMDILFSSKYNDVTEEMNHFSVNVILFTLFIIFIKDFWKPKEENGFSKYLYNFVNWFVSY